MTHVPKFKNTTEFCDEVLKDVDFPHLSFRDWQDIDGRTHVCENKKALFYRLQMQLDRENKEDIINVREDFFEAYVWQRLVLEEKLKQERSDLKRMEQEKAVKEHLEKEEAYRQTDEYKQNKAVLKTDFQKYAKKSSCDA